MSIWPKTAFVFPGQGSQIVGMGKEFAEAYPAARELFEQADDILAFPFTKLCFEGPEEILNDTLNTQPALFVCSIAILCALKIERPDAAPACVAGHSLGEFTALAAAGALTFEDGLRLVLERGRLMKEAGEKSPGAMAAVIGLDTGKVREVCAAAAEESASVLVLANDNCPGQVVISGDNTALERALVLAKEAGAKMTVKLAVSIAAHSPLMQTAAEDFQQALAQTPFQKPAVPVYANVTTQPLHDVESIRNELNMQLTQSVRWTESVQAMIAAGVETFVEIGPKDVLTGLLKRIDRSKRGISLGNLAGLQQFSQSIA